MDIELPNQPPLEIVHQGRVWTVAEYRQGRRDGTTFSSHESQMDAVRAAKEKMERDKHPCVLRWESQDSVQNIYWSPLFENLDVAYDELVQVWTAAPAAGTFAIDSAPSREDAVALGKQFQRTYDFKRLRVYDRHKSEFETREHRFIRNNITDTGVRFNRNALQQRTQEETDDDETLEEAISSTGPATPGLLGVSIPDVTQVEFIDTDGVTNKYQTPWGDGTTAQVLAISRKYADHEAARDAVVSCLDPWRAAAETEHVATVHEAGTDPAPWVAYRSGDHGLDQIGLDCSINERVRFIEAIAEACGEYPDAECAGIRPENIRLRDEGGWHLTVANWGIEWAVSTALSMSYITPFTAPEQTAGNTTEQTSVYQLAAVAYWLFCEQFPVDTDSLPQAIRAGNRTPPDTLDAVPSAVEPVLLQGLSVDPDNRHGTVHELAHALLQQFR